MEGWTMNRNRQYRSFPALALIGLVMGLLSVSQAAIANPSATGRADISTVYSGQPLFQRYSFSAIRHQDGRVTGQWQLDQDFPGFEAMLHGRVTCLSIVGNTARIGGIVERSSHPFYQQDGGITWTVADMGEGGSTADLASYMSYIFFSDPAGFCATGEPALPMTPSQRGNIQVKP
jgi:hypothetical protein